ncbi:MAG: DUF2085 domain-containing protein [Chloroflexi bacterium]|nr:DUF2085 domain-containing protein [Chloroflexota bacterium]
MSNITTSTRPAPARSIGDRISQHWLGIFFVVYGLWVWLPWLAPISMHFGWDGAGKAIYLIYSFFCHQLPERSFFLFGQKSMYSLTEVQAAWQNTLNPLILRKFIGDQTTGWKVAWSDRMVSFYTSVWIFAVLWFPLRRKIKPLPWWGFALFLLPIAIDGGTHMISDFAGIGQGFRDSNQWLAALTNNVFPATFYAGDALGSFNSWMRLITGLLAGLGITWLAFPYMSYTEIYNQKLEELNYGKVIEQIKSQNPRSIG